MRLKNIITVLFAMATVFSCTVVDPLADEQYEKTIYIVGAYNNVATFELPYGENQEAFVSVAVSGTLNIDRDVDVTLADNSSIIDWYNGKYMLDAPVKYKRLDNASVAIASWKTTIRAGEVYARLPFTVNSTGLHCDSLYAIGLAIESVSGYQKATEDTELVLTFKLTNEFSGNYQMEATKSRLTFDETAQEWVEEGMAVPVSIQRALTAVSADTVRFFHEKTKETLAEYSNSWDPGADYFDAINSSCITFGKAGDKFTVHPYGVFPILDGEATFEDETFTFSYDYTENSTRYRMKGTLTK